LTGIGRNQHLPPLNKKYNQEKGGKKSKKREKIKKKSFLYYVLFKITFSLLTRSVDFVVAPKPGFCLMVVYVL